MKKRKHNFKQCHQEEMHPCMRLILSYKKQVAIGAVQTIIDRVPFKNHSLLSHRVMHSSIDSIDHTCCGDIRFSFSQPKPPIQQVLGMPKGNDS